ncbi:MAG: hypothetical protein LBN20_03465 [Endomicrobium sp.]|jgi:hypothetical protein|nr:hypothetical protein [Endomicrobium sp.]
MKNKKSSKLIQKKMKEGENRTPRVVANLRRNIFPILSFALSVVIGIVSVRFVGIGFSIAIGVGSFIICFKISMYIKVSIVGKI